MALRGTQRIHIAPQGYETERVYHPIIENNADKAILLYHMERTDKGDECKRIVEEKLGEEGIKVEEKECDNFDLYSVLYAIGEIVKEHEGEDIFVNLSTGSKITAISGMIACMATGVTPYYVRAKSYRGETISQGVASVDDLPAYPIGVPDQSYLEVLEFIVENETGGEKGVAKGEIVAFAMESNFPQLSKYNRQQQKDMYEPVGREIIEPLRKRGYVEEQRRGQEKRIWLTNDGKNTLDVFRYLLAE